MRAPIVIVVLLVVAAGAWFGRHLWAPPPATQDARVSPPPPAEAPQPGTASREAPASEVEVREQAERYVAKLTEPDPEPVKVERADHFVTGDQMLSLIPNAAVEDTTVRAIQADPDMQPDTPITVIREVEQVERVTPEKLIAQSGGDLESKLRVLRDDEVRETTVRQVLENASREPEAPIDVVTTTEYFEQTTPRKLAEQSAGEPEQLLKIIRGRHGLEASSVSELMRDAQIGADSLFYVRTVRPGDAQGIWGIVHDGIISNFGRGMAIRRGREINTYQVRIPRDADEREADRSSSFLGKLIHDKTKASYVYNFNRNRMGRNPDRIVPGQEIVIIDFRPQELIRIYRHFVERQG